MLFAFCLIFLLLTYWYIVKNNSLADIGTNAVDVNFNTADGEGKTIAHVAAELGEYSILQMLIDVCTFKVTKCL